MSGADLLATIWLFGLVGTLAWFDLREFRLPNIGTTLLFGSGILFVLLEHRGQLVDSLVGAGAGAAVFLAISVGYMRLRGRSGLGLGDAKLMAGGGVWVGWSGLPMTLLVGSLTALCVTVAIALVRRERLTSQTRIPLGAYLGLGICYTWLFRVSVLPA